MDIHKPKPWHGVREFLKEYVIIVVGVLTALGAEQVAEAVHTAQKAAEAEDLVREEFARNITFAKEKGLISPCNQAKFQMVERLLLATPADRPIPQMKPLDIPARPYVWRQWEAAVASGIEGHFPAERRAIYERVYLTSGVPGAGALSSVGWEQHGALAKLAVLTLAPRKLDAAEREALLEQATLASADEAFIAANTRRLVSLAEPLHLPPAQLPTHLMTPEKAKACLDAVQAEAAALPPIPTTGG